MAGNNGQIEDDYADLELIVEDRYTKTPSHRFSPPIEEIKQSPQSDRKGKKTCDHFRWWGKNIGCRRRGT